MESLSLKALTGGGSSGGAQFVGNVTNGSSFPTHRLDGSALQEGDYVRPSTSSTFPFVIGPVTFNSVRDKAIYSTAGWMIDPGVLQDTSETPVKNKTDESLSENATTQRTINVENKTAIEGKVDKDTSGADIVYARINNADNNQPINKSSVANTVAWRGDGGTLKVGDAVANTDAINKQTLNTELDKKIDKIDTAISIEHAVVKKSDGTYGLMQVNINNNAGLAIVRRDLDKQVHVPLVPTSDEDAVSKAYVDSKTADVDNITVDLNALDQIEIKDSGVKNAKIEDDAVTIGKIADANISTAVPSAGAVDTKLTTEKAVKDALDLKQDKLTAGDNITIGADSTIKSNQIDDALATSTEKTYSIDKIKEEIRIAGATFRGAFNTKADLDAYTGTKEKNDRAIVTKDETHSDSTTLYSYNGTAWVFEYVVSTKPLVLDEITIDYNASGELEVKDEGISLAKFAKHASDGGKAYTISASGDTVLNFIANYKRVSTFAGVSGDIYTAYYLDAPCIVGSVTYEKGVYVWTNASGFELIANTGTGGGSTPILVGVVSPGGIFPVTRPDASALIVGDYVKPYSGATFPFTIGTVTFTNARDTAVYMGSSNWLLNASVYQKTNETPVNNKTNESINGATSSAVYQADINAENKTAINSAVNTGLFAKTSDGKINLNLKDRQGNDVVNENIENVVFTDDAQTLKNKTIDADDNTITDLTGTNLKAQTATEAGKTYVVQSDGTWALGNAGSDVDNLTIDKNASGQIQIKDEGINFNKMNPNAVGTDILADPVPTRLATNQAVYEYGKVDTVSIDRDPTIGINIKDEGVTFSKFHNDTISNHIPQTAPSSTKLTTESAVKNAVDKKQNKVVYSMTEPTGASEGDLWIKYEEVTPGVAGNFSYHRYDGGTWVNISASTAGDYLPLAGGTMEGTIKLKAGDNSINTTVDNSYVRLAGATNYEKGASLILKGKNSGMNPGSFVLTANSDGSGKQLIGQSSGALWWCGKELQSAEALLDIFYPIGSYFFGDTPPSLGNWHEVEGDRAVWIKKGTADGTTIDQTLPKPSITCSSTNTGTHIHARGNQNIEGHFNFFWENYSTWGACIGESCSDANPMFQVANRGNHRMRVNAKSNWTGEMAQAGDHNHAVSAEVKTSGAYGTGEKVQPDALVMRVWKRLG